MCVLARSAFREGPRGKVKLVNCAPASLQQQAPRGALKTVNDQEKQKHTQVLYTFLFLELFFAGLFLFFFFYRRLFLISRILSHETNYRRIKGSGVYHATSVF